MVSKINADNKDPKGLKTPFNERIENLLRRVSGTYLDEHVKEFCKSTLMFMAGKRTNKQMMDAFDKLLKAATNQE